MEVIERNSIDVEGGTCDECGVRFWIHRQRYQILPRAEGRCVIRGAFLDPWWLRIEDEIRLNENWYLIHSRDRTYSLMMMSSNLSSEPFALYTSYRRGIWMSHLTLWEKSLLLTIHFASLSHSSEERPYILSRHSTFYPLVRVSLR